MNVHIFKHQTFQRHDLLRVRLREIRGLLKCYRRVAPGTPGGVPVDAPPPSARASA